MMGDAAGDVTPESLAAWIASYERLWRTAGTDGLSEIFSDDVTYSMGPYEEPVRGIQGLRELWDRERLSAEESFEMAWRPVAVDGDEGVAVVRVDVSYGPPRGLEYRDLWVIRFAPDGRCENFEEWPYWPGQEPLPEVER